MRRFKWRPREKNPEWIFSSKILLEFPRAIDLRVNRPDFYDPEHGFIEVKTARRGKNGFCINNRGNFNKQLEDFPRPLTVIILDEWSGEELARYHYGKVLAENKAI